MAKFNDVIIAIAKSVAEAEAQLEETQLTNLSKYFKIEKNKNYKPNGKNEDEQYLPGLFPVSLKIGLPDENNQYGNKYYSVPYINLIPISQLNIDSITASFDVSIVELLKTKKNNENSAFHSVLSEDMIEGLREFNDCPDIAIDIKDTAINKEKGTNININISIKKTEPSEGMSKLINEIRNFSQGLITLSKIDDNND